MNPPRNVWNRLALALGGSPSPRPRLPRRAGLSWDSLEERTVMSHTVAHHAASAILGTTSGSTSTTAANTALQTLRTAVQAVEAKSGVTVGDLTALTTAFQALKTDGLTPGSKSALTTFENHLVSGDAADTTLAQFEALYSGAPTTQQATDLTAAYNALVTAVSHSNITTSDITTVNTDYANFLKARGSTSTATYPLISLVTGRGSLGAGLGGGPEHEHEHGPGGGNPGTGGTTNTAVTTALQTLRTAVQAVEAKSGVTVFELSSLTTAFQTLRTDGLTPGSKSALTTFENNLVSGDTADTTLAQFEALYTASPTTQQTTDLTAAYNALTAAVASSNITAADITSVTNAYSALLTAEGSTSTAAFPLLSLVTGQPGFGGPGFGGRGGHGGGGC